MSFFKNNPYENLGNDPSDDTASDGSHNYNTNNEIPQSALPAPQQTVSSAPPSALPAYPQAPVEVTQSAVELEYVDIPPEELGTPLAPPPIVLPPLPQRPASSPTAATPQPAPTPASAPPLIETQPRNISPSSPPPSAPPATEVKEKRSTTKSIFGGWGRKAAASISKEEPEIQNIPAPVASPAMDTNNVVPSQPAGEGGETEQEAAERISRREAEMAIAEGASRLRLQEYYGASLPPIDSDDENEQGGRSDAALGSEFSRPLDSVLQENSTPAGPSPSAPPSSSAQQIGENQPPAPPTAKLVAERQEPFESKSFWSDNVPAGSRVSDLSPKDRFCDKFGFHSLIGNPNSPTRTQDYIKLCKSTIIGPLSLFQILYLFLSLCVGGVTWPTDNGSIGPSYAGLSKMGGMDPMELERGQVFRLWTPALTHAGILHCLFNLVLQLNQGLRVECALGMKRTAFVCFLSTWAGVVTSSIFRPDAGGSAASALLMGLFACRITEWFCKKDNNRDVESAAPRRAPPAAAAAVPPPAQGGALGMLITAWRKVKSLAGQWWAVVSSNDETKNVCFMIAFTFIYCILPGLSEAANFGGLIAGTLAGVFMYRNCISDETKQMHATAASGAAATLLFGVGTIVAIAAVQATCCTP